MNDLDNLWEIIIAVLIAALGGLARMLGIKDKKKVRLGRLFSEVFISAFSGLMVLLLARAVAGLHGDWLGLVCGMAGWIGPRILDMIVKPTTKILGLDEKPKDESDDKK